MISNEQLVRELIDLAKRVGMGSAFSNADLRAKKEAVLARMRQEEETIVERLGDPQSESFQTTLAPFDPEKDLPGGLIPDASELIPHVGPVGAFRLADPTECPHCGHVSLKPEGSAFRCNTCGGFVGPGVSAKKI